MSQIRRKRTVSDRKPLGRLLSWTSDRTGIPEDGETEGREERGHSSGGVSLPHGDFMLLDRQLFTFFSSFCGDVTTAEFKAQSQNSNNIRGTVIIIYSSVPRL